MAHADLEREGMCEHLVGAAHGNADIRRCLTFFPQSIGLEG